jgi:molybdate transport system substrate-binding protein
LAAAIGLALTGAIAIGAVPVPRGQTAVPRVAAASDLSFALDDIAARFQRDRGSKVQPVYGSSGTLTRQILDGAPFELFLSADEAYIDQIASAGLTRDRGVPYAIGRLVIFAPTGSSLTVDPQLAGVKSMLAEHRLNRFAIANPAHAPYGRAAEAVLRKRGLWTEIQPVLALGENISQAAQFATTGGAAGGILSYSLVLSPTMKNAGTYALISVDDHPPLRQRMALLKSAGPVAQDFYGYLQQPAARAVFSRHGFTLPDASAR